MRYFFCLAVTLLCLSNLHAQTHSHPGLNTTSNIHTTSATTTGAKIAWIFTTTPQNTVNAGNVNVGNVGNKVNTGMNLEWTFEVDSKLPKSYAEARQLALTTGKPLVVWVGAALCPHCVKSTHEEFVHWVAPTFPDTPADALVVGILENGDLTRIATMTEWPEGHLTTIRKSIQRWRTQRTTTSSTSSYRPSMGSITYRGSMGSMGSYGGYGMYSGYGSYGGSMRMRSRSSGC